MIQLREALKIADLVEFFPTIPNEDIKQYHCDAAKYLVLAALRALGPTKGGTYDPHIQKLYTYLNGREEDAIRHFSRNVDCEDGEYKID